MSPNIVKVDDGSLGQRIQFPPCWLRSLVCSSIDPRGSAYYWWLCIICCPVGYNLVIIIARSVYADLQATYRIMWFVLDYVGDGLYLVDAFIRMRTGFHDQGLLVADPKLLLRKYTRSYQFALDIASVFPTDLLYVALGVDFAPLRFNRLLKLTRLQEFTARTTARSSYPNMIRICVLVMRIVAVIHWNGCLYFAISGWIGYGKDPWVYPDTSKPEWSSLQRKYLYCLYWSAVTLTNVGEPNEAVTDVEFAVVVINYLVGIFVLASIVGSVGNAVRSMGRQSSELQQLINGVKRYMKQSKVGKPLEKHVIRWFDYVKGNKQNLGDAEALAVLPERLREDIAVYVHMDTLRKVKLFEGCERALLVGLALRLRLQVFSPGDYVCRRGDIGREMYIVKKGALRVVSDDGIKEYASLKEGSVFGEVSILNIPGNKTGNRRTANVRSVGYSDLYVLSKDALWEVLEEYPEATLALVEKGREILRKDNLVEEGPLRPSAALSPPEERLLALRDITKLLSARLSRLLDDYEFEQTKMEKRLRELESALTRPA